MRKLLPVPLQALPQPDLSRGFDSATANDFRLAMRHLASGVSVITTGRGDFRAGLTATSVNSLSMEPPALVVCIDRKSSALPTLRIHRVFGANFLASTHRALADRFAGRDGVRGSDRFSGADWIELTTGAPILADAMAAIDCSVEAILDWHTHALVIGRVEAVHVTGGAEPLVYWNGNYIDK